MANRITQHKVRQELRRKMRSWGMQEDEIEMCIVEVKRRQALKERGELDRKAQLCTRPAYVIMVKESKWAELVDKVVDALIH